MIQLVKGTKDIYGAEVKAWQRIEGKMRNLCETFGIGEIRTPAFEFTELFVRGVGETTDIVQKEMYTFTDDGDRSLTLRPEGTAGAVRAYIEHGMHNNAQPTVVKTHRQADSVSSTSLVWKCWVLTARHRMQKPFPLRQHCWKKWASTAYSCV